MQLEALNQITTHLNLTPCDNGWQASLHMGGSSYRVRVAPTPSEAVRAVLEVDAVPVIAPPPY